MGAAQGLCLAPVKGLAGGMSAALSGLWGGDGLAQAVGVRDAARCWGWVRDGVRGAARTGRAAALGTSRHLPPPDAGPGCAAQFESSFCAPHPRPARAFAARKNPWAPTRAGPGRERSLSAVPRGMLGPGAPERLLLTLSSASRPLRPPRPLLPSSHP